MSPVTFKRIAPDETRILAGGEHVGDLYRHPDILNAGAVFYVVHLCEDPRGPVRVHERSRIRRVVERQLRSHPLFG